MSPIVSLAASAVMLVATIGSVIGASPDTASRHQAKPAPKIQGLLDKNNLPTTGQDWVSLKTADGSHLEYQPNDFVDEADPHTARRLRAIRDRFLLGGGADGDQYSKQFVDGGETYYPEYAQAWRLLGFYIDCGSPNVDGECGGGGGEQDANGNVIRNCVRYLLWAAYVDLDYTGEGIGEYMFFDRHAGSWDRKSCVAENGRCAPFDCHLSDTNFKLLGLFKEASYREWMEQLFKHEGVCVWTEDEYSLMQQDREFWPCACTQLDDLTDDAGNPLYYDMKPAPEGRLTIGLYTEPSCSVEYSGDLDPIEVIEAHGGGGDNTASLAEDLEAWNAGFDVFKQCQPCKAYDLHNDPSGNYNQGDHHEDDDGDAFACHDAAGYNSVNQCMKFRTKTKMLGANFKDVALASEQGTITEINLLGSVLGSGGWGRYGKFASAYDFKTSSQSLATGSKSIGWFVASLVAFVVLFVAHVYTRKDEKKQMQSSAREPLVSNSTGVVS